MYIKSITLEGFKSYRDRTVVGPFDRHFNAITGLNGSGKSNILDAICFVLGVNSLQTVRATCLADLIYKGCGVSRASVSITFDNSDKDSGKCPPGFEDFPEIIVSRVVDQGLVCKYYLNSLNSTKNVVADMFQSVGININHPNFIIMQGKITKVVNMKPLEVLQMIEETCGATAYQKKRDRIERDMIERQRKMEGTAQMIQDVIIPALDEQTKASGAVQEYHFIQRELNEKEKSLAIVSYLNYYENLQNAQKEFHNLEASEDGESKNIEECKSEIERQKARQEDMNRNARMDHKLEQVTKEYDELKRPHQQKQAQVNSANLNKEDALKKATKAKEDYTKEAKEIEEYKAKSKALIDEFESIQKEIQVAEENVAKTKDTEEKIRFGNLVTESGDIVNVGDRLNQVIATLAEAKGKCELSKKEFTTTNKAVQEKEGQLQSCPKDDDTELAFRKAQENVNRLQALLRRNQIDPEAMPNLENLVHEGRQAKTRIENKQAGYQQRYPYLHFTYTDPKPNFDRKSVLGFVYEHFSVKDIDTYGGALDVAVGGSLSKMVVDTPETSQLLINKGNLARRTTFLPLSATKGWDLPRNVQQTLDKKFGVGKATLALNLIEYDPKMSPIITSVFGSTVICVDMATAKTVAFQMGLNLKAVTLDGDVVDPGGVMQGGSRDNIGALLRACQALRQLSLELKQQDESLAKCNAQLETCRRNQNLVMEHSDAVRSLQQCADIRALTTRATLTEELATLKTELEEKQKVLKAIEAEISNLVTEEKSLQSQLKNEDRLREKNLKDNSAAMKKWEKALQSSKTKYEAKKNVFQDIELELHAKADFLKGLQKDIDEATNEVKECDDVYQKKQQELEAISAEFEAKHEELQEVRAANKQLEKENQQIMKKIEELGNKIHELEIAHMKRTTIIKDCTNKIHAFQAKLEELADNHRGTEFHPNMDPKSNKTMEVLKAEVHGLRKKHEDMRHRLDFDKAAALRATQQKINENQKMFKQTKQTRKKIEQTISALDNEKLQLVKKGYAQINEEFGTMMAILLPDSQAKLVPVNDKNLMDGMNIHVCLGGVWKESLTELSGGQRSLVALALVLSLCMYNAAPFYVLDEIDAALDLNHTQNIGYLLRHKFRTTQFVCVSLKDGMYTNANVLFQTTLLNGTSHVKRETPNQDARKLGEKNRR